MSLGLHCKGNCSNSATSGYPSEVSESGRVATGPRVTSANFCLLSVYQFICVKIQTSQFGFYIFLQDLWCGVQVDVYVTGAHLWCGVLSGHAYNTTLKPMEVVCFSASEK